MTMLLDPLHIGRWAKNEFGSKSSVTAVFMTHAVINDNPNVGHFYQTISQRFNDVT